MAVTEARLTRLPANPRIAKAPATTVEEPA
jgi:hypothetical protein